MSQASVSVPLQLDSIRRGAACVASQDARALYTPPFEGERAGVAAPSERQNRQVHRITQRRGRRLSCRLGHRAFGYNAVVPLPITPIPSTRFSLSTLNFRHLLTQSATKKKATFSCGLSFYLQISKWNLFRDYDRGRKVFFYRRKI